MLQGNDSQELSGHEKSPGWETQWTRKGNIRTGVQTGGGLVSNSPDPFRSLCLWGSGEWVDGISFPKMPVMVMFEED